MQGLIVQTMSPLTKEQVTGPRNAWLEAISASKKVQGRDLPFLARCGQEALQLVQDRISQGRAAWALPQCGGSSGASGGRSWVETLEELCRDFVERCAEVLEGCQGAAPPRLAARILGHAVKLAEILGKTGPLLAVFDDELALLHEKVSQIEVLIDVLLKRCEEVAGESSDLKAQATEAIRSRDECRQKAELVQDSLRADAARDKEELKRAAQARQEAAERQHEAAERQAAR